MLQSLLSADRVNLSAEQPFAFGDLHIDPSRLTVRRGDAREGLEPRVMAVLVVLAQASGRVVSRDELVDRCWDGRIVGDNAIQRTVSRLRHLSATVGGFEIQTITKIGYLLRAMPAEAPEPMAATVAPPVPAAPVDRRLVIGAGAALAAAAAGMLAWNRGQASSPDTAAVQQLIDKARDAEVAGQREANLQAIAYLKRATELDPRSANAWGALALAYQNRMEQSDDRELPALADWTRSAADRALALDPGSISARLALATIPPNFQRWAANERVLRGLRASHPPNAMIESALGWLLCDTGRWQDAIGCYRKALAIEPFHPVNQLILSWALWGAGNLDEAEQMLSGAIRLWPQNRSIWQARFDFLALTGRPDAALALVDNDDTRPVTSPDQEPPPYAALRAFAVQMQDRSAGDADRVAAQLQAVRHAVGTYSVLTYLLALGQFDAAYVLLEQRLFGGGPFPPPGPLSRRKTSMLFSNAAAPLRRDPRFQSLTRRTGLDAYWRETGTRPDAPTAGASAI